VDVFQWAPSRPSLHDGVGQVHQRRGVAQFSQRLVTQIP
jgi:hypothetical protein